jgi:hypothetical protein
MPEYLTRHADGFILTAGKIEPGRCTYAEFAYPGYVQKRAALSETVGVDQFLWAIEATRKFPHYEMTKPVEWLVRLDEKRLLGYVDDNRWFRFLQGQLPYVYGCFRRDRPTNGDFSVLLPFPLRPCEVVRRRVYKFLSPDRALLVEDKMVSQTDFGADFKR